MEKDELWEELRFEIETMNRLNSSKEGKKFFWEAETEMEKFFLLVMMLNFMKQTI